MGYQLNSLHWLQALLTGEQHGLKQFLAIRQHFQVMAFVLHDPEANQHFHTTLQRQFTSLHRLTGKDVLFFVSGLDEQQGIGQSSTRRVIRDAVERLAEQFPLMPGERAGNGVPLVAHHLGLSDKLPTLLVLDWTGDQPQWSWTPTSAEDLWMHLEMLTAYSVRHRLFRRSGSTPTPLQSLLHGAQPLEVGARQQGLRLSQLYLQAAQSRVGVSQVLEDMTCRNAELQELATQTTAEDMTAVETSAHDLNVHLRALSTTPLPTLPFLTLGLEEATRLNVISAWHARQALSSWEPQFAAAAVELGLSASQLPSYAGPVVELGSALERELQLSIGQSLRALAEVPFPQAFNRYHRCRPQDDFKLRYHDGHSQQVLDMNRRDRGGKLWVPPVGKLRTAFLDCSGEEGAHLILRPEELDVVGFAGQWEYLAGLRNDAAHANRTITAVDFDVLLDGINGMHFRGELAWLLDMKQRLQRPGFLVRELWSPAARAVSA